MHFIFPTYSNERRSLTFHNSDTPSLNYIEYVWMESYVSIDIFAHILFESPLSQ